MNIDSQSHIETELTLVVCDEHPEQVCEGIEALPSVGGLRAGETEVQRLHDKYYDTPDGDLRSAGWGLRIRQTGACRLLALKGRTKVTDRGIVQRTEIEGEWSLPILEAVLGQLTFLGLARRAVEAFDLSSANATLVRIGFMITQDRDTLRKVRDLLGPDTPPGRADAELIVDRVVYSYEGREFVHHEVEIEAASPEAAALIPFVHEDLVARFGGSLRVWLHSKLATGWALKRLVAEGRMDELVKNRLLLPAAYDVIDETLARELVPHP